MSLIIINKAYRPNAHLLYIVMQYNGNVIYFTLLLLPLEQTLHFEQTLITHTQGLFVCNIIEFCWAVLENKIFKGLHYNCYVPISFGY